ncbi:MAG: glycosyltransferase [Nitrosopumilus sp.]|nr:glycosyltransferase [Nitrosopumilus sp.]
MTSNILYLFTSEYPYGSHESYLENEIVFLAEKFDAIYLFPRNNSKGNIRVVPKNVIVVNTSEQVLINYSPPKIFFSNILLIIKILLLEFVNVRSKWWFLKNIRKWNSNICQSINLSNNVKAHLLEQKFIPNAQLFFYSYWMNDWALMLAVLKDKKIIGKFVFRVLGFDIYNERWEHFYVPFRYYIYSKTDSVFTVSKSAATYLKNKKCFPEKIESSYMGTNDFGLALNFSENDDFVIYSCSNIIKLKRLSLIVDILKNISFRIKWIHRGDGEGKAELLELVKSLPKNVEFELLPREEDYNEVLQYLKKLSINLFINVSESEGLPVTIIEAVSMGIPVLATDVGGTSEIVTKKTGILIEKDFEPANVASVITDFRNSDKNKIAFRHGARQYWQEHFSAKKNYELFCKKLIS